VRFIIDHLGIMQPRTPPTPPQRWADLPKVLEVAKRPNAVINRRSRRSPTTSATGYGWR
jgi:hypothetical protein